jgi:hypothetical protein
MLPRATRWTIDEIKPLIVSSIKRLVERDFKLILADVAERCVMHKFGQYVEWHFPGYDTDCEYNKDGHDDTKVIDKLKQMGVANWLSPDIIVHGRWSLQNVLIIQGKKSTNKDATAWKEDEIKLIAFTEGSPLRSGNLCKYDVGLFITFDTGMDMSEFKVTGTWYIDGKIQGDRDQVLYRKPVPDGVKPKKP